MANDINIDSLSIEIKSDAEKAVGALNALEATLSKLSSTTASVKSFTRISNQLNKLSDAVKATDFTNLSKLTTSLDALSRLTLPDFSKSVNSIARLTKSINDIQSIGDITPFTQKIAEIAQAVRPLETLGKNTLAPFISSLRAIPKITAQIDTSTLERFKKTIQEILSAITPLADRVDRSERGLSALNGILQATMRNNNSLASSNAALVRSYTSLGSVFSTVKAKIAGGVLIGRRLARLFGSAFEESNKYVENLNLFTVTMGDAADEAFRFAKEVNNALGVDTSSFLRYQGVFKQITSGFGVITEKANLMSKNLTQIGYDISSFFNIDIEEAMTKVQSGISGELEPLRRLGYALDAATLQQIAYDNGIRQNINTMTQAQKSQLRYVAILQQSTNVMGDMARTVTTPANSMRILNQQITQFKRAVGDVVSVLAVKLIPYLQVGIRLLTDLANKLAEMWGFELPEIDYSGMEKGISSVGEDADEATDAVNDTIKAVQRLAGFDEINVLKSAKEDADDTVDQLKNNFDLGIDLPEYDFLQGVENATEELYQKAKAYLKGIYEWFKKHKKLLKEIAVLIGGIWAVSKITKFIKAFSPLATVFKKVFGTAKTEATAAADATESIVTKGDKIKSALKKILGVGVGSALTGVGSYNLFYELERGTSDWLSVLTEAGSIIGGIAVAYKAGGPIGAGIAAGTGLITGMIAKVKAASDEAQESLERLIKAEWYTGGGVKISEASKTLVEYLDKLTSDENVFLKAMQGAESTKKSIKDVTEQINIMLGSLSNADNVDLSAVDKIKTAFDDLAKTTSKYIDENKDALKVYIASNAELLRSMGVNASNLYSILDNGANDVKDRITDLQKEAENLLGKGANLTEADKTRLNEINSLLAGYGGVDVSKETKKINELKESVKSLASVNINLESPEIAFKNFKKMASSVGTAIKTISDAREKALSAIDAMKLDPKEKESVVKAVNAIYDNNEHEIMKVAKTVEQYSDKINERLRLGLETTLATNYLTPQDYQRYLELKSRENTISWDPLDKERREYEDLKKHAEEAEGEWKEIYDKLVSEYGDVVKDPREYMINTVVQKSKKTRDEIDKLFDEDRYLRRSMVESGRTIMSAATDLFKGYVVTKKAIDEYSNNTLSIVTVSAQDMQTKISTLMSDALYKGLGAIGLNPYQTAANAAITSGLMSVGTNIGTILGDSIKDAVQKAILSTMSMIELSAQAATIAIAGLGAIGVKQTQPSWISKIGSIATRIKGYAGGGVVNGDLFLANENGRAEFISSIGNKPAVANQEQMRSEIRQGVKEGVMEAMSGSQSRNGDIYIYLDSDQIAYRMDRNSAAASKRTGGR